jgi:hypothetical protein
VNVPMFRELCEQAVQTDSPSYLRDLHENIDRVLDNKRRELNLLRRRTVKEKVERRFHLVPDAPKKAA